MKERLSLIFNENILNKFKTSKILIIGIGGVGGYALECLVRSGFENITIVDKDIVDETNLNRQIISLKSNIGLSKVEVAKKRILDINPNANINIINEFILEDNIDLLNIKSFDYIIDACDTITTKILLIEYCNKNNIKLISCMGTGNRIDSTKLSITKLNKTYNDPLAKNMRRILREKNIKANPNVVWSSELPVKNKSRTPGSIVLVPMQAGNLCASFIINDII
ncbi:MAG: tRNA threonylcarbamoyladenosine dehydratase [Firmicutes bacterium]|nr:tRNA threonylcarbamoyladenosine dehydratase [Bacillota bacterium]